MMVRTILWRIFLLLIVVLIVMWFLSGGLDRIKARVNNFNGNPLQLLMGFGSTTLPWSPVSLPRGPDISGITGYGGQNSQNATTFGNPSPYASGVSISSEGAQNADPHTEYLVIHNDGSQTLDITGWALQSLQTRAQAFIPRGASFFALGAVNQQTDIELPPGGVAIVATGVSPVGTSFRENICSGYLGQLQSYAPQIQTNCPSPSGYAAQAAQFGQACADFVSSLPACTFPQQVSNLPSGCQAFVQTDLSYNGCVQAHQGDPGFATANWRVFLGASQELWSNTSDTIRLLDGHGQVVAVTSY
ncbi:MAG TPA: hypothetical protein VMU25_02465 [Candidatus Paceibacterota bacterium]|nr:hypothetical protein [Candidatus Paceibacterota bacterium]